MFFAVAHDTDIRLMLRVRDDGDAAFEELVNRYNQRLVRVLYHLVGDADDAEDLAQEVFLRIYRSRKRYEPTAKFSTWLFTIANNLASNALRDRRRRRGEAPFSDESGPLGPRPLEQLASAPSGAMPSRIFAKAELADVVREAVGQLSEEQRLAVVLNKFEHLSYREISEVMGKSEMAIKSLLSRARLALRSMLEPYLTSGEPVPAQRAD